MSKKSKKYDFGAIEKKWQEKWKKEKIYEPDLEKAERPFYNLMMFPYPSAEGLHVGNMYAFTGSDIYGRFKRMKGYNVFEPIGLDGFGIHSENYALKIGTHPIKQSEISEKRFYKQLEITGNSFAWNERVETYKPEYYKWTQWIFIQMWKQGLAHRKKQKVNWCPSCKTVLADEQVEGGKCERCGTIVIQKELEQWFFKITKYAEKLLKNLDKIDWSEKVKIAQRNWIGKSEGALLKFQITNDKLQKGNLEIEVFTTRPDTLFGATYLVLSPEHEWLKQEISNSKSEILNKPEIQEYINKAKAKKDEERIENKEKTGVKLEGISAVNPANKKEIPIFIADYVLSGYGTGAIMAVPAHDERDFEFAKKFKLGIVPVIIPSLYSTDTNEENAYLKITHSDIIERLEKYIEKHGPILNEGYCIQSGEFDRKKSEEAKEKITKYAGGRMHTQYRLRDWLVSRQRYWGAPIPMIYCDECAEAGRGEHKDMPGWYAVPEKNLPVELPMVKDFRPKGKDESPLASVKEFYETKCPNCGGSARRETDVSDTFLDSAWYYIAYLMKAREWKVGIEDSSFVKQMKKWLPVDMYIGGAEHSVLHLLYSRFVTMTLKDGGFIDFEEPFKLFRAHGLLIKDGAKISKSKGNIVNPDDYVKNFGADTFRMYLMFLAPFEQGGDFRDQGILGIERFLKRIYFYFLDYKEIGTKPEEEIVRLLHQTIKKVTEDIEALKYNTAISQLMVLLNGLESVSDKNVLGYKLGKENHKAIIKLLSPFAPHLAEELWEMMEYTDSIYEGGWPEYDKKIIQENVVQFVVQVNGKHRATITFPKGTEQSHVENEVKKNNSVERALEKKKIKKIIFIKDKLINFVI